MKQEDFLLVVFLIVLVSFIGLTIVNEPWGMTWRSTGSRTTRTLHNAAPSRSEFVAAQQQAQCNDGVDNDGDGKADYPDDEGCTGLEDVAEEFACKDGYDNDNDGAVDGKDAQCSSDADDTEDIMETCRDGRDNDSDGKTDYPEDEGCSSRQDPTESLSCNDGYDNDNDGKVDGRDPQCSADGDDTEDLVDMCQDGRDNDGDNLSDYPTDDGCDSPSDPREN